MAASLAFSSPLEFSGISLDRSASMRVDTLSPTTETPMTFQDRTEAFLRAARNLDQMIALELGELPPFPGPT